MILSLSHLNGNALAAIDIETTGRVGGVNEIVQIAIVPLSLDLEVIPGISPFYQNIKPNKVHSFNRLLVQWSKNVGLDIAAQIKSWDATRNQIETDTPTPYHFKKK